MKILQHIFESIFDVEEIEKSINIASKLIHMPAELDKVLEEHSKTNLHQTISKFNESVIALESMQYVNEMANIAAGAMNNVKNICDQNQIKPRDLWVYKYLDDLNDRIYDLYQKYQSEDVEKERNFYVGIFDVLDQLMKLDKKHNFGKNIMLTVDTYGAIGCRVGFIFSNNEYLNYVETVLNKIKLPKDFECDSINSNANGVSYSFGPKRH